MAASDSLTGGDHHGPDVGGPHVAPACRGGQCDDSTRCAHAGACTYRSSADEFREVVQAQSRVIAGVKETILRNDIFVPRRDLPGEPERTPLAATSAEIDKAIATSLPVRTFATGANRDGDTGKLDYEGFLSPAVLRRFAEYMHKNRFMRDGSMRDSDNWQKGIPLKVYMKSMMRHFMSCWLDHRLGGYAQEEELVALMFNVMGYLHERLKGVEE